MESFDLKPIGFFKCNEKSPYEVPRQASQSEGNIGYIEFKNIYPLIQALEDIESCPKLWLVYLFHRNKDWRPKVMPPRGSDKKVGVLATRAPYRPNPIGLSCVDFVRKEKNKVWIKNHDLLDDSPILDIKPYLSMSDSFLDVKPLWLKEEAAYDLVFSEKAMQKLRWLSEKVKVNLMLVLKDQLSYKPFMKDRKRIKVVDASKFIYSYKTWRFDLEFVENQVYVKDIFSGYSKEDLVSMEDPYKDKTIHKDFIKLGF